MFAALFFTVALLVVTAYFIMGSLPLLVLKHDTPLDSRFIRGFFDTYYKLAMIVASATALAYAVAGRPAFAIGAAAMAVLAFGLRGKVIGKMDVLRSQMQADQKGAIPGFRKTHLTAIAINLVQLVLVVWTLISFSIQLKQ